MPKFRNGPKPFIHPVTHQVVGPEEWYDGPVHLEQEGLKTKKELSAIHKEQDKANAAADDAAKVEAEAKKKAEAEAEEKRQKDLEEAEKRARELAEAQKNQAPSGDQNGGGGGQ